MAVTDKKIHKDAKVALQPISVSLVTAISQTDLKAFAFKPGYEFEIVSVQTFCSAEAGTVTADVKIGTVSALASPANFTAGTRVDATLSATVLNRRGTSASELNVHYTTDATGSLTNGRVIIVIRPRPLNQEA